MTIAIRVATMTLLVLVVSIAHAATLEVPSIDYPTLASALGAASDGDEVVVATGTYYEFNLMLPQHAAIVLRGATGNPEDVVIDAQSNGRVLICQNTTSGTRIEDLTVQHGLFSQGAGINTWYGVVVVENCIVRDNIAEGWGGGGNAYGNTCDVRFIDCQFIGNHAVNSGGAFYSSNTPLNLEFTRCRFEDNTANHDAGALNIYDADATVSHCTFVLNSATNYAAAVVSTQGTVTLDHCVIAGNLGGGAVFQYASGDLILNCCDLWDNVGGNWTVHVIDQFGVDGNIEADPQFCSTDGSYDNLHLQSVSPCADCLGDFMGAYPVACDETMAGESDWSALKALY